MRVKQAKQIIKEIRKSNYKPSITEDLLMKKLSKQFDGFILYDSQEALISKMVESINEK